MNRKLKALGMALAALLAIAASAGSAPAAEFHSESATDTQIQGSQSGTDVFTVNAGTVTCNQATYAGTQSGATSDEISVVPAYTECAAFGFINAPIDVNGCPKRFTANFKPVLHLHCSGSPTTITAFNCHVTVGPQTWNGGISFTNEKSGSLRGIRVHFKVSGVVYTQQSKSFPGCTNGTFSNGTYSGEAVFQGFTTGGTQVGIWFE